jgi:hypothetical protein
MRPFRWAAPLALALTAAWLSAQAPASRLTLDYLNPGLNPSHWVLTLAPDGSGHFRSERNPLPPTPRPEIDAPEVDRPIHLDAAFAARLFHTARGHNFFQEECDANRKVAFQGWKTLSYSGSDGEGSCRYNYAHDREIESAGDSLMGVASSILEGARLEKLLQYDRLGLDREMEYLTEAVSEGHMLQLATIRGVLERISEDPAVMERVRKRSRQLLTSASK